MNWGAARRRDLVSRSRSDYREFEGVAPSKKKKIRQELRTPAPTKFHNGVGVSFVRIGDKIIDVGLANPLSDAVPDFLVANDNEALALIDDLRLRVADGSITEQHTPV